MPGRNVIDMHSCTDWLLDTVASLLLYLYFISCVRKGTLPIILSMNANLTHETQQYQFPKNHKHSVYSESKGQVHLY